MTTFMDVIGSQSCPGPFAGILCESDTISRPVISQGISFQFVTAGRFVADTSFAKYRSEISVKFNSFSASSAVTPKTFGLHFSPKLVFNAMVHRQLWLLIL